MSTQSARKKEERCFIFRYRKLLSIVFWVMIVDSFSLELFLLLSSPSRDYDEYSFRDHFQHLSRVPRVFISQHGVRKQKAREEIIKKKRLKT
jgi:hypothetical protein